MQSILNHRKDTSDSLGLTAMLKDLLSRRVRSNLSSRYSTTAKRFQIRLCLLLAVALTLSVLSQSAVTTQAISDSDNSLWNITGNLNNNAYRTFHTATLLPNGKVLGAGGANGDFFFTATKSAELYDPATGTWTLTGNLIMPRSNHRATLLPNGKVLVAGGIDWDEGGPIYDSPELYDPATGIWSATGSLSTARCDHTATLLANGKVLVAGGLLLNRDYFVTDSAELYDPSTGNWSTTGSLITTRHGQTATLLPDGKVLAAGGSSTNNASNTSLNIAELYDPSTGTWSLTPSLNMARQWHTATLLTNGTVLIAGGDSFSGGGFTTFNSSELYGSTDNSIDDPRFFVRQQYLDFLNRQADDLGLAFWTNEITSCGFDPQCIEIKRINVSAAFFLSIEFQQTGYLVYRMYGDMPGTIVPLTRLE